MATRFKQWVPTVYMGPPGHVKDAWGMGPWCVGNEPGGPARVGQVKSV